jgi:archaeal type IV pilus assembly protein PilA
MGKMKANRKFKQADERAVSAVIGVILMVAITVAIAATVYVYVSGMIGGQKQATPTVLATPNNTAKTVTITNADPNLMWSDVTITTTSGYTWTLATSGGSAIGTSSTTWNSINVPDGITAGDVLALAGAAGTVKVTMMYKPTNSLLGTWNVILS